MKNVLDGIAGLDDGRVLMLRLVFLADAVILVRSFVP